MRDAPALAIVPALIGAGAGVAIVDPHGEKEGAAMMPGAAWVEDPYEAARDAAAVVVITEWNMFRGLDLKRLRSVMAGDVLVDLRNIYHPEEAAGAGFVYSGVGRPAPQG
jgi:UDPglucose 6-dehydrogenase